MVMKTLVGQLDILETMTPMSFTSFRDRLESASGFQSAQFRELEFVLGYKRPEVLEEHSKNAGGLSALKRRLDEPSVMDHFYDFLESRGFAIPDALRDKDVASATIPHPDIQAALVRIYRERPDVSVLLELLTDFDEGLQEWRYRHVKMVERTIGLKPGTGGSSGAAFLRATLFKPVFPDLWEVRHRL
jgi:tryptophan 2,3-dioxygenase